MKEETSLSSSPPPWALRIAAQLCALAGALAVVECCRQWFAGHVYFKADVLLIPIAFCLLRGDRRSWWTVMVAAVVAVGLLAWWIAGFRQQFEAESFRQALARLHWSEVGAGGIYLTMYALIPLLLLSGSTRRWLRAQAVPVRGQGAWLVVPIAAGVLAGLGTEAGEHGKREVAKAFFVFDTKIAVFSEETGRHLDHITIGDGGTLVDDDDSLEYLQMPRVSTSVVRDGVMRLQGWSGVPFTKLIWAPGYAPQTVVFDRLTPPELSLRLKTAPPRVYEARIENWDKPGLGFRLTRWHDRQEVSCFLLDPSFPEDFSRGRAVPTVLENAEMHRLVFRANYGDATPTRYYLRLPTSLGDGFEAGLGDEDHPADRSRRFDLKFSRKSD